MDKDQIALNIINYWKDGVYNSDTQKYAKLQCLIVEAMDIAIEKNKLKTIIPSREELLARILNDK